MRAPHKCPFAFNLVKDDGWRATEAKDNINRLLKSYQFI